MQSISAHRRQVFPFPQSRSSPIILPCPTERSRCRFTSLTWRSMGTRMSTGAKGISTRLHLQSFLAECLTLLSWSVIRASSMRKWIGSHPSSLSERKIASDNTIPIVIGLNVVSDRDAKSSRGFFRILSELCEANNVTVRRKFSNTLANGLRFFSLYVEDTSQEAITHRRQHQAAGPAAKSPTLMSSSSTTSFPRTSTRTVNALLTLSTTSSRILRRIWRCCAHHWRRMAMRQMLRASSAWQGPCRARH